jgi:hypothetical protein
MKYVIAYFLLTTVYASAQTKIDATHTVFGEALGPGIIGSLNYDKILFVTDKSVYSARVGIATRYYEVYTNKKAFEYDFPLMLNRWNNPNKKNHFETGIGAFMYWGFNGDSLRTTRGVFWGLNCFVGYRFQKPEGGWMVRVGWSPFYDIKEHWLIWYWIGGGIGYTF